MKKLFLTLAAIFAVSLLASAQPRAIGLRLGYGAQVSYQHSISENMLSIDAGSPAFKGFEVAATYDWINPGGSKFPNPAWNWYAGVGAAAGIYFNAGMFAGAAGRIGLEYTFKVPVQISMDWRPILGLGFNSDSGALYTGGLYAGAIAIGIRYRF